MDAEKNELVSIIVPVYNTEKYLAQCIESILNQTYSKFELLLINDGSTDGSGDLCDTYAKQDRRISVIHQKNAGVSMARNTGLDHACGEYIMFVDSDDYIDPELVEEAHRTIRKSDADIYICGLIVENFQAGKIVSKETYAAKEKSVYSLNELLENMNVSYPAQYIYGPCHKLYRRKAIENEAVRFDLRLSVWEDFLFNQKVLAKVRSVQISDKVYYHYRKERGDSLSSSFNPMYYDMTAYVFDQMRELLKTAECTERRRQQFEYEYFETLIYGFISCYFQPYKTTGTQDRLCAICKVSENRYIQKLSVGEMRSRTQKVILLMLKLRLKRILDWLLIIRYQGGIWGLKR